MNFLNRFSLKRKILIIVGLSCFLCAGVSTSLSLYYAHNDLISGIVEKSQTIHSRLDAAMEYVALQAGLEPIVVKMKEKYQNPEQMSKEDKLNVLKQVPVFAAMKIGAKDAEKEGYVFRVFSEEPRNKDNQASAFETTILNRFRSDKSLSQFVHNDGKLVTVYRPIKLSKDMGCLVCHGNPSNSPWGNGKDILGYKMENWDDGKIHAVFAVSTDIQKVADIRGEGTNRLKIILSGVFLILSSLVIAAFLIKNPMNELTSLIKRLNNVTSNVTRASADLSSNSVNLSQATIEQMASLQETAASLEEIGAMVKRTTENAQNTYNASQVSQQKTNEGNRIVTRMIDSIGEIDSSNKKIKNQIDHSHEKMGEIVKLIHEISQKTNVINDIVFQTKLLSFNASVEAARAGEHGKGFAVVAEEIGNLASMSGKAATEIGSMLGDSIKKVEGIVVETKSGVESLIQEGNEKVQFGKQTAFDCGAILNDLVKNSELTSNMAQEISEANSEQSTGINEISKAMSQLDIVTQNNTLTSQTLSQNADGLNQEAIELERSVEALVKTINGE